MVVGRRDRDSSGKDSGGRDCRASSRSSPPRSTRCARTSIWRVRSATRSTSSPRTTPHRWSRSCRRSTRSRAANAPGSPAPCSTSSPPNGSGPCSSRCSATRRSAPTWPTNASIGSASSAGRPTPMRSSRTARAERRVDLTTLPAGVELSLGLFRSQDVRNALLKGHGSHVCARQLVAARHRGARRRAGARRRLQPAARAVRHRRLRRVRVAHRAAHEPRGRTARIAGRRRRRAWCSTPSCTPAHASTSRSTGTSAEGRLHLGFVLVAEEDVYATST